jgi:hypothetical protein
VAVAAEDADGGLSESLPFTGSKPLRGLALGLLALVLGIAVRRVLRDRLAGA